jgi:hypothetical protein
MFNSQKHNRRFSRTESIGIVALGPVLAFSLAACGGSSSTASTTPSAAATGAPGGGGGANNADFAKIQACLKAAGITVTMPSGGARPPGGARPSGTAQPRPSGSAGAGGGPGGGGGMFSSAKAQAAIKACGLTVPTGGGRGGAQPTASAT